MQKIFITKSSFEPTEDMKIFADVYSSDEVGGRLKETCKRLGESTGFTFNTWRDRFYKWRQNPLFNEWLSTITRERVLQRIGELYAISDREARKGSFPHLKLLMELAKEYTPTVKNIFEGRTTEELLFYAKHGRWADQEELKRMDRRQLLTEQLAKQG